MNRAAKEWVEKAEEDYAVAIRENRARKPPAYGTVCFHAQQCIEKYLKAVLTQQGVAFAKIHDLAILLATCLPHFPQWEAMIADMKRLSGYAVRFRYPGDSADKNDAQDAVRDHGTTVTSQTRRVFGRVACLRGGHGTGRRAPRPFPHRSPITEYESPPPHPSIHSSTHPSIHP